LATFRAIARKYPSHDPKKILLDLATSSGDPGRCFAAAKDAGFLDLAVEFAATGRTDPRTLRIPRDGDQRSELMSITIPK
jgi:membrane-associated PAP2 superfamily phosphatase